MNRKPLIGIVVFFACTAGISAAQETLSQKKLGITLDATYVSRYIWRGFDCYPDNHGGFQPSIDLDLYQTGFGVNIWASAANQGGFEDSKELDYTLYYTGSFLKDDVFATDYKLGWAYYSYPGMSRKTANMQEVFSSFSWPKLLPGGLVPSYTFIYLWPAESHSDVRDYGGAFHIFGLGYTLNLPKVLPNTTCQPVQLGVDVVYNDGAYIPNTGYNSVDHDWSHAVFKIASPFELTKNFTFTPGFYYQSSWEDSVNENDEYWFSLSLSYKF